MPQAARRLEAEDQPRDRADLRLVTERAERESLVAQRRTVVITGNPGPRARRRPPAQRHPARRSPAQRQIAARPDRVALWAFLMGLFLIFMAVATAHAAV
jgi:hypothetical protein